MEIHQKLLSAEQYHPVRCLSQIALGGTFDYCHSGHKLLLAAALLLARADATVTLGVTSTPMLQKKDLLPFLQSFEQRAGAMLAFAAAFCPGVTLRVTPMTDQAGPTLSGHYDGLVLTAETLSGGLWINAQREKKQLLGIPLFIVELLRVTEDAHSPKISSSAIRVCIKERCNVTSEQL